MPSSLFITIVLLVSNGILITQSRNAHAKLSIPQEHGQDLIPDVTSNLPNGIFHYINRETESNASFRLPQFDGTKINPMTVASELLSAISSAKQNEEDITGISLPMPFGMKPLNVQLGQKRKLMTRFGHPENEQGVSQLPAPIQSVPEMDHRSWKALKNARAACLYNDQSTCDQALERYHQIRYHKSPVIESRKIRALMLENPETIVTNGLLKWLMPNIKPLN